MKYKIVVDSACTIPEELKSTVNIQSIPLTIELDGHHMVDDETFDQVAFLKMTKESPNCPKSACPSPEAYKNSYEGDFEAVFVVTISHELSGSYGSATLAKSLYEEEFEDGKKIEVLSSESAACGQLVIAKRIIELCEAGLSFEEVVEQVHEFRDQMDTYFVLETLDTLKKNGRLTGISAVLATALNIKPVMGADKGNIIKLDQVRGINRALKKMVELVVKNAKDTESKVLGVCHCNCPERAELVKEMLCSQLKFKEVVVTNTTGLATMYANEGGVIIAL